MATSHSMVGRHEPIIFFFSRELLLLVVVVGGGGIPSSIFQQVRPCMHEFIQKGTSMHGKRMACPVCRSVRARPRISPGGGEFSATGGPEKERTALNCTALHCNRHEETSLPPIGEEKRRLVVFWSHRAPPTAPMHGGTYYACVNRAEQEHRRGAIILPLSHTIQAHGAVLSEVTARCFNSHATPWGLRASVCIKCVNAKAGG